MRSPMKLWRITCQEDKYPGMWQRWYKHQCVAVGWPPGWGFKLEEGLRSYGWSRARNAIKQIEPGHWIIVTLSGHRVGRLGQVTDKAIAETDWNPFVQRSRSYRYGEIGRRILVRWDMIHAPDNRDQVILLPERIRFTTGELRPTICEIPSRKLTQLQRAMNDPSNWVGLDTYFDYESALQGYIAAYPHDLEDGMLPHSDKKIREKVFKDRTRSDVLLIDRDQRPVIVECKQGPPSPANVAQIRHYMRHLGTETKRNPRGILVHGGALKLAAAVRKAAAQKPKVEIVRYTLKVDFDRSK
jgi:hypothetical protein